MRHLFQGRKLLIASQHKKEEVIQPLLDEHLGTECFIIPDIDTDRFGTFTGERERILDPRNTVLQKCRWAMDTVGVDLAVASEGSFGPHPSAFFLPANEEWVALIDYRQNIEVVAREITTDTNYNTATVQTKEELLYIAPQFLFPSHGLILRPAVPAHATDDMVKGIQDAEMLLSTFHALQKKHNTVRIETDMRAMVNPTRMKTIRRVTENLIETLKVTCPTCMAPGFGISGAEQGLPCRDCGCPTRDILAVYRSCTACHHEERCPFPDAILWADPGRCDRCNP